VRGRCTCGNFSKCFFCVLFFVLLKVRWKFQTVFGVCYTLQTNVHSYHPQFWPLAITPVYANDNGRDHTGWLQRYFLEPMMRGRQHSPGWWSQVFFFPFWGRVGVVGFLLFPICSHEIFHSLFIKFASSQYVPQVSNVFPNLFPIIALTLCHIAKFQPEKYDFNLCKGFSMEKNGPNSPDFQLKKKGSRSSDFYDKFH